MKNKKSKTLFLSPGLLHRGKKKRTGKQSLETIYDSPAASISKVTKIVGFILRALVLYIGLFGIVAFLSAAAGLTAQVSWQACYISYQFIAFICLPITAVVTIASLNRLTRFVVPLGFAGSVIGICTVLYGDPFSFLSGSILRLYNFTLYHLASAGFGSLGNFMISDGLDYANASYMPTDPKRFWGVFILAVLIGALLGLCMLRKVRLIPLCAVIALVVIPVFTYNMSNGNIGIGCIIAFCLGCIVLKVYDYRYAGARSRKTAKQIKRREKKALRQKERARKLEEKKALHAQADQILKTSLDTDLGKRRSRMARNAVFIAWRKAKKENKAQMKKAERDQKKQAQNDKKAAKKAEAAEKKELTALKKSGNLDAAATLLNKRTLQKEAKRNQKATIRKEKQQKRKEKQTQSFTISAAGGFAAFGATVLALLALWIPMTMTTTSFPVIAPINNKVQIARSYVTAYLTGNDVDLNDLSTYGINELIPRSLSFDPLEYKDKRILRVETTGQGNVYLRSWTGSDFDRDTNTWSTANYDQVLAYRSAFGKDFSPDEIKYNFNKYIYPSSVEITEENVYKNLTKYGFTVQQVHVQPTSGSSLLLFVPAHMNTQLGLRAWGSLNEAEYKYSNYYDGVYSSRFYKSGTGYSTVSFITSLSRSEVAASQKNAAVYYQRAKEFIKREMKTYNTPEQIQEKISIFDQQLAADGIEYIGTSLVDRYFHEMSEKEQTEFWNAASLEENYRTYAQKTYTQKFDSAVVQEIAAEIKSNAKTAGAATNHDLIMAVVDYLSDHYTYTQTPDDSAYAQAENSSVLDAFLSQVKEGYCTHFATAAAAILREYDIPVRFVEGYVASDFSRAASNSGAPYRCDVKDRNAHAWIEVYFDGMGWMQYEVTPGSYAENMYNPSSATISPAVPDNEDEEEQEPPLIPDEPDPPEKEMEDLQEIRDGKEPLSEAAHFLLVIGIAACAALLGFIVYLIVRHIQKKAQLMLEKRYRIINFARKKEAYESADSAEQHRVVRQINDWIMDIFRIMGIPPETGELPMDFAKRVSEEYANLSTEDFTQVMTYIQKEEFGHGLSAKEAEICGEYLSDLIASVYAGLDLWQKIRVRYIKRIL